MQHCCLYEYAREFVKLSRGAQGLLRELARLSAKEGAAARQRAFRLCLKIDRLLRTKDGDPHFRPRMTREPWLSLGPQERNSIVVGVPSTQPRLTQDQIIPGSNPPVAYTPPLVRDGKGANLTIYCPLPDYLRELPSFEDYINSRKAIAAQKGEDPERLVFGFFCVDFDFPPTQIRKAFSDWLAWERDKRDLTKSPKSGRGKEKDTSFDKRLWALGVKRLSDAGLTFEQATRAARNIGSKPFYYDKGDWSRAKNATYPETMAWLFGSRWRLGERDTF